MSNQFLTGVWTYRSFLNIPNLVEDFNDLRYGQGEITFESLFIAGTIRGQLAFRSNPPERQDPRLRLSGSVEEGNPLTLRFQGNGVAGTSSEGWVYDYVGYLVPKWPNANSQQPALLGTVIRTIPHGDKPAGVVGSFIAVQRKFPEPSEVIPLPENVRKMLASKTQRLHHAIWHGTRGMWNDNLAEDQKKEIRNLGWQPGGKEERPATLKGAPLVQNGSGEDFLFMHREMIQLVNEKMAEAGKPFIKSWATIPAPGAIVIEPDYNTQPSILPTPGNPDGFSVPPMWFDPVEESSNRRITHLKSDGHYWSRMRWWDREFKNAQYLSTLSLGELGSLIEFSVHNDMHMRWASVPRHPTTGEPIPQGRADADIRDFWDDPHYDFLGEFYSSHVNPIFWRLHGWVDDRIDDWYLAHQARHPGEVVKVTVNGVPWFKKGKWVHSESPWSGPEKSSHESHTHDVTIMKRVMEILFGPSPADAGEAATSVRALRDFDTSIQGSTRLTRF